MTERDPPAAAAPNALVPASHPQLAQNPLNKRSRDMNARAVAFWLEDAIQLDQLTSTFERLNCRYPAARAHRLLEVARVIVDQHTIHAGTFDYAAAVAAALAIEELRQQHNADTRWLENNRRKAEADQKALKRFCRWQERAAGALTDMDAAQRVNAYLVARDQLPDRERRRLRRLSREGRVTCEK